ncbi:hypothetical protein ACFTY7_06610 [Streptomyces sp. NPDC057062]|uniref:hypothetical protein n=1 Tax=Streptomyces sp. NPDC057062 TaxID=3346011 RepID=UPI00362EB562
MNSILSQGIEPPADPERCTVLLKQELGSRRDTHHLETLIHAPKTAAPRRLRLRQLLAWLQAGWQTSQPGQIPIQRGITIGKSTIESSLPETGP